jgi:hypothetical protein
MPLVKATLQAYGDFIKMHKKLSSERKLIRRSVQSESSQIYRNSIVVRYMLGRRTFDNIKL